MRPPSKEVQREKSRGPKTGLKELPHPNPNVIRSRGGASRELQVRELRVKAGEREPSPNTLEKRISMRREWVKSI